MIPDYSNRRPQSFIYQQREVIEDAAVTRDNAFIFGPATYVSSLEADATNIIETSLVNSNPFTSTSWSKIRFLFKGDLSLNSNFKAVTNANGEIVYFTDNTDLDSANKIYIPVNNRYIQISSDWKEVLDTIKLQMVGVTVKATSGEALENQNVVVSPTTTLTTLVTDSTDATSYLPITSFNFTIEEGIVVTPASASTTELMPEGYMTIEFKATKVFNSNAPITKIASPSDIIKNFGPIVAENRLAMGCQFALAAGDGKAFYADVVDATETTADYTAVLTKAGNTDVVQFLAPLSSDQSVGASCLSHVTSLSTAQKERWRRCYFGSGYQTSDVVTKAAAKAGVIAQSRSFSSDRLINVWCDGATYLTDTGEKELANYYVAAIVAALRATLPPQQGLSMQTIPVIANAKKMFTLWNTEDLDEIAEYGTFIITQDYEDQEVYIRHQLTTETSQGIMYWEDSVGVNYDEISYAVKDTIKPFRGKRNGTQQTLTELKNRFYDTLLYRTNSNYTEQLGPQIKRIIDGSVKCYIDPNMLDRVVLTAKLVLPLPINTIVVYLNATASII